MSLIFRAFPRIVLTLALTFLSAGILVLVYPLHRLAPGFQRQVRNAAFRFWGRSFSRIVGMHLEVVGTPPTGTFYLVANHMSYMDIVLLSSQVDASFVAKAGLRSWPGLGAAFAVADTIFIDRERRRDVLRVMEVIDEKRAGGLGVVVFPEGTAGSGDAVLPFKPPLLDYAARRDCPVHHATISYRTRDGQKPARETVCWWGDMPLLPHVVGLFQMPGFDARVVFGDEPLHDTDRKALAVKLRTAVAETFEPSSPGPDS